MFFLALFCSMFIMATGKHLKYIDNGMEIFLHESDLHLSDFVYGAGYLVFQQI